MSSRSFLPISVLCAVFVRRALFDASRRSAISAAVALRLLVLPSLYWGLKTDGSRLWSRPPSSLLAEPPSRRCLSAITVAAQRLKRVFAAAVRRRVSADLRAPVTR